MHKGRSRPAAKKVSEPSMCFYGLRPKRLLLQRFWALPARPEYRASEKFGCTLLFEALLSLSFLKPCTFASVVSKLPGDAQGRSRPAAKKVSEPSMICACFGSLSNLEAPQSPQTLNFFPSLLCLPSSRVRTPAMITDVVAATLFAGLLFVWSLLSGIAFWWCSLVFLFFGKWFRRRGLRTRRFRVKCRRQESCFRMKLRDRWVRVWTQRQLVVVRKEKVGCSVLLENMLRKCRLFWHVFLGMFGMFGMLCHVRERGNDEQPRPAKAEISEHRLRALHRGLPLPG